MPLDDVCVLHGNRPLQQVHGKHLARAPLRTARHHLHGVAVANPHRHMFCIRFSHGYQTSGASEMILVNFFSRNSRATGPNTRVPTGSPASLISTAALSSNRMYVPSLRRCSFLVRTTTAFTTVPCFTWLSGAASFTEAVTPSPNPATSPASPPNGRMAVSRRAPELSATVSHVRICTMLVLPLPYATRVERARISASRQRFSFESGRLATIRTVSPGFASLRSS